MHEAVERINKSADVLREEAPKSDALGRLTDVAVQVLKESGGVRLLQPKKYGGYEAHPNDFFDWVMAVGNVSPSAGWVAGVVGIHPWEIALMDPRLQEEIWGEDNDTWTASPYAPFGRAKKVDGGFLFTGQWPYSTGTDASEWVILGGFVTDDEGNVGAPPDMRHFVIPRKDYEIVEDSWNVMGLAGTGSKDVRMTDVFIPDYRVVEARTMIEGGYADERQPDNPLYRMFFGLMFPAAICAGTIGIAEGALASYVDYMRGRVNVAGTVAKTDPFQLAALAEASADIAASRAHFQSEIARLYDQVVAGVDITPDQRLQFRRDQVRASRRVVEAIDKLFNLAGASAIHTDRPLQQYWRDLHAGASHICNVAEMSYVAWGQNFFGGGIPATAQY